MYTFQKLRTQVLAILLALLMAFSLFPLSTQAAESPIRGNSSGNLINKGFFAQQEDWVYYYDPFNQGALTKARLDGSESQVICEYAAMYINVSGDWIYFVNDGYSTGGDPGGIFRIKTDGSGLEQLFADFAKGLTLDGDWLYFYDFSNIYRIKIDGSDYETVGNYTEAEDYLLLGKDRFILAWGGNLYYTDYKDPAQPAFMKLNADSKKAETLKENCEALFPQVHEGQLYFWEPGDRAIFRCHMDGTGMTTVYRAPGTEGYASEDGTDMLFFQAMDGGNYISMGDEFGQRLIRMDERWQNEEVITRADIFSFGEIDGGAVYVTTRTEGSRLGKDGETIFYSDKSSSRSGTFIAEYDGWVYFVERDKTTDAVEEKQYYHLYRAHTDGSNKIRLSDEAFLGIGMQYATQADDIWIDIYHNRVYYPDSALGLRSVSLSGHGPQQHLRFIPHGYIVSVVNGWAYYFENETDFKRIRLDGTQEEMLSQGRYSFAACAYERGSYGGYVYEADENKQAGEPVRFAITDSGRFVTTNTPEGGIISVSGEKVIYEDDDYNLMVYDAETGETSESPLSVLEISGYYQEWFYISDSLGFRDDPLEGTWRVRYDGTSREQVSKLDSFYLNTNSSHLFINDYATDPIKMYEVDLRNGGERFIGFVVRKGWSWDDLLINDHIYISRQLYDGFYKIAFDEDAPKPFVASESAERP